MQPSPSRSYIKKANLIFSVVEQILLALGECRSVSFADWNRARRRKKHRKSTFFQVDLYSMFLLIRMVILDLIVFTFVDCAEGMNNSVPKRINSELRDPQEILSFQITLAVSIQSKKPANKEFMLSNVLMFLPRVQGTDLVLTESSLLLLKPSQELGA